MGEILNFGESPRYNALMEQLKKVRSDLVAAQDRKDPDEAARLADLYHVAARCLVEGELDQAAYALSAGKKFVSARTVMRKVEEKRGKIVSFPK